ncbi:MAG: hypothetical protein EZS28_001209 [Streblomastix strix]|uniref:Uncharacterized protein n=1 Tax=Streblomastix strix TaxID=222440 RepID=A0A5J4X8Y1_9EUKA|nr:MAG: hypothetical protein EZS28_001209 [Streblomastix strix]
MNAKLNPFSGAQSDILSSCPIAHTAQIPSEEDTQVDGDTFTSISDNSSTILFDPVIKKGIVKFEFQSIYHLNEVGIADKTVKYERKDFPDERGQEKIVRYNTFGKIEHIGDFIDGNAKFWNNEDRVTFEMDMDSSPRTLTFFVNDEELPNYVTNIPAAVRAFMLFKNESFKVLKFEALSAPTAKHGAGSRA